MQVLIVSRFKLYDQLFMSIQQIDVSFSCICPVIDHEFCHNIVKLAVDLQNNFDNVMTKFIVYNRTDA